MYVEGKKGSRPPPAPHVRECVRLAQTTGPDGEVCLACSDISQPGQELPFLLCPPAPVGERDLFLSLPPSWPGKACGC